MEKNKRCSSAVFRKMAQQSQRVDEPERHSVGSFPTTCSQVTAETRHHVSTFPTVNTQSHRQMSSKSVCCLEL